MEHLPAIPNEGPEREAFWTRHIEAWRQSELSQRAYARAHGLPIVRFTYWKNKLCPSSRRSAFVEVEVARGGPVRIHHHSGVMIECTAGTDARWLQALLGLDHAS